MSFSVTRGHRRLVVLLAWGAFGCSEKDAESVDAAQSPAADLAQQADAAASDALSSPDIAQPSRDAAVVTDTAQITDGAVVVPDSMAMGDVAVPDLGPPPDASAAGLPFGEACGADSECAADLVCRRVGMLGMRCTLECQDDAMCPEGSEGKKCNNMGLCRP